MKYFSTTQMVLCSPYTMSLKERTKLDKFLDILDESGVAEIIQREVIPSYERTGRAGYNPYKLFAGIIYAFSKHSGSVRKIEESMEFDLRFLYLMEGQVPSYVTISKFLNNVVVKHHSEIFSRLVKTIVNKYGIAIDDVFIDGTKLEANANKYKFVWKPVMFQKKLCLKIRELMVKYITLSERKVTFVSKEVGGYLDILAKEISLQGINLAEIQFGKGHRQKPIVKDYILLTKYLYKLLEYEEKNEICGPRRNSYYKTDVDATAMCLKSDYYSGLGSNMHAAYNIQLAVSKGLILDYYVSQERADGLTFIPFLEKYYLDYGEYPLRICADAGYGSLLNYRYLNEKGILNYVKYTMWQQDVDGKRMDAYTLDENGDIKCMNGLVAKEFSEYKNRHTRYAANKLYVIEKCARNCIYASYCKSTTKNQKATFRIFETSKEYLKYKVQAQNNLLSVKGIEMRVNRSSQVEGAFGVLKQDMDYDRARRRGLENVETELMLVCLGYNLKKLFSLIDGTAKMDYWVAPIGLVPEEMKKPNLKKLLAKTDMKKSC